jgi:hypothetical protein
MPRTAFGALLIVHGLITITIWVPRPTDRAPMSTSHSWLFGEARVGSLVLAILAGLLIVSSGTALLAHQGWWCIAGLAGAALSLALFGVFFTPWWLLGISMSTALGVVTLRDIISAA